jgi:hypothetical protein
MQLTESGVETLRGQTNRRILPRRSEGRKGGKRWIKCAPERQEESTKCTENDRRERIPKHELEESSGELEQAPEEEELWTGGSQYNQRPYSVPGPTRSHIAFEPLLGAPRHCIRSQDKGVKASKNPTRPLFKERLQPRLTHQKGSFVP